MRMKQLEGRIMAAAKTANPTAQEFSGMDYQQSARITRTLGQMAVVVQPTTNPRYEVAPCCTSNEFNYCPQPGAIFLEGVPITYSGSFSGGYDFAIDISWIPAENATSYVLSMTYNNGSGNINLTDFIVEYHTITNITIYTSSSYTNIILTITAYAPCGIDPEGSQTSINIPII
jgi:hypothetical protein